MSETTEQERRTLGAVLRAMRAHRGYSQAELARRAGVSLRTIRRYEQDGWYGAASVDTIVKLAVALNATCRVTIAPRELSAPTPDVSP